MIKLVSDLRQVGGFLCIGTPVSSTNKTDRHDITEILLEFVVEHHKPTKENGKSGQCIHFSCIVPNVAQYKNDTRYLKEKTYWQGH